MSEQNTMAGMPMREEHNSVISGIQSGSGRYCLHLLQGSLVVAGVSLAIGLLLPALPIPHEQYVKAQIAGAVAGIIFLVSLTAALASGIGWLACRPTENLRFSLRDALLAMLVLGLSLGWWVDHNRDKLVVRPMDRSWVNGTVSVEPFTAGKEMGLHVSGEWPDASPDLWIRGSLSLIQEDAPSVLVWGTRGQRFSKVFEGGVGDYSKGSLRRLPHPTQPHQAVFDYEIWSGKPGRGRLLTKNSVLSEPILPP